MPDRGERRLDRVGGADALPVRGRKAAGRQQLVAVLRQLLGRLRLLFPVGIDQDIERGLGAISPFHCSAGRDTHEAENP